MLLRYKELERRMFLQSNIFSIAVILIYITYDSIAGNFSEKLYSGIFSLFFFVICLVFSLKVKNLKTVVNVNFGVALFSIFCSFFYSNGFKGVFVLDFTNVVLIIALIMSGSTRKYGILFCGILLVFFIYIQVVNPELITDIRQGDSTLMASLFVSLRFLFTICIGIMVKLEYEKEKQLIGQLNQDLVLKNDEIQRINNELEYSVNSRTSEILNQNQKMINFSFYGSQNSNGSLSRLLSLVYVLKMIKPEENGWDLYKEKLEKSNVELDEMIEKIDIILKEGLSKSH